MTLDRLKTCPSRQSASGYKASWYHISRELSLSYFQEAQGLREKSATRESPQEITSTEILSYLRIHPLEQKRDQKKKPGPHTINTTLS
jgi:hypothetical protein